MVDDPLYRELAEDSWAWVLGQVRDDEGPWVPVSVSERGEATPDVERDCFYCGIAGLAPVLAEISQHRALTDAEHGLQNGVAERLYSLVSTRHEASLYDGLAGDVVALRLLAPGREQTAMQRLSDLMTPAGWVSESAPLGAGSESFMSDVVTGTAGVIMTAIWAGGEHAERIAVAGGEALLRAAEPTRAGLDWGMWPGATSKGPNYSHGTAGIASALAISGTAFHRPDFVEAAVLGAEHLVAIATLDANGFLIPHTIPASRRQVEPVTFTWCHGPAGTSHVFAALSYAGVAEVAGHDVIGLRQRCFDAILNSGVPKRLRPGFWDNDGRCCGTAGVGDVLLDAVQDSPDTARRHVLLDAARTMGDALVARAIRDGSGARWRFLEHTADPPLLPPGTSWMQGAAGIATYLMRLSRVIDDPEHARVVDRPDQWWAVPAELRTVHGSRQDPSNPGRSPDL